MHKCPNCNYPLKIVVHRDKRQAILNSGFFQLAPKLLHSLVSNKEHDPLVRLETIQDGTVYRDELEITNSEFKRIAYAMSKNNWLFSVEALERWGAFTSYRAKEIAGNLSEMGLRFVDRQNRSTLLRRLTAHLRNALSAPD